MDLKCPDFPTRIEIELSALCNLKCSYCPRHFVKGLNGFIDTGLFQRIIDEAAENGTEIIVLHRRGESFLHPNFADLLTYCRGRFKEIQIATNGTVMGECILDALVSTLTFISFSIDLPERMKPVRGADYRKVDANISAFLERNDGRVTTQVSMVRADDMTQQQCDRFIERWSERVDRVRIYEQHSSDGKFGSLRVKREGRKPCVMPFYEVLVYCDGSVGRCNHDWDGEPIGDVRGRSLLDIWHGEALTNLREQHLSLAITDATCAACDSWYPAEKQQGTGITVHK